VNDSPNQTPKAPSKGTASLAGFSPPNFEQPLISDLPDRNFFLRLVELFAFLIAVVGAIALGLGITDYFHAHIYIAAYLLAYAGFRLADLLVREDYGPNPSRDALGRRIADQAPVLILFAAAPFERTYLYGGDPRRWLGAMGLLIELIGLWLALGARIQLAFFSFERRDGANVRTLVRRGFYRYIRHPMFIGIFAALIAWPIAYAAPISLVLTVAIGIVMLRSSIRSEEKELLARYGEEYARFQSETDALIPGLW
jgi:protein-S-isoprenylcysteine O-methyltransferase Ste14